VSISGFLDIVVFLSKIECATLLNSMNDERDFEEPTLVLDIILESLATITGVVSSFAMLPQIYRIFSRKSAKDLSIWTYSYMLVAGVVWFLYGINIQSFPVWVSNLIGSITMAALIVGWFLYGR
jgi:MtN3 and saliva related transmembrane protein